jgi:hypothetical protein
MTKLTDTQLIVLSKAAQREDGIGVIPERMPKAAAAKVGASLVARKLMRELRSKPGMPVWRKDKNDRSISLIITRPGRDVIGVVNEVGDAPPSAMVKSYPAAASVRNAGKPASAERPAASELPRTGSKKALVIALLSREEGATLGDLTEATGWLPHTTRAAMTGLRKRGFAIERTRDEKAGSLYRIVSDQMASVGA